MTRNECQQLVDAYVTWLRRGFSAQSLEGGCELTTPFLDRHNDQLQVYAVKQNGKIILSDDGYTLSDLRTIGVELTTPKRKLVLQAALSGFGVQAQDNQLLIEASARNVGQRLHSLIQAMLTIMAEPRVATFFWDDVRDFLDSHLVRYSPRIKLAGLTGYDHAIDFLIPRSEAAPERIVQAINAPSKNTIGTYLFILGDTREALRVESEAYALLNDRDHEVGGDVTEASVIPTLWSRREHYVQQLAA
jgi:hypothetical protein